MRSLVRAFVRSRVRACIRSLVCLLVRLFACSLVFSCVRGCVRSLVGAFVRSFVPLVRSFLLSGAAGCAFRAALLVNEMCSLRRLCNVQYSATHLPNLWLFLKQNVKLSRVLAVVIQRPWLRNRSEDGASGGSGEGRLFRLSL